jgi:predicted nucleic acid-binding protein
MILCDTGALIAMIDATDKHHLAIKPLSSIKSLFGVELARVYFSKYVSYATIKP